MWQLYRLMGKSVPDPISDKLIDNIYNILKTTHLDRKQRCIEIFFGNVDRKLDGIDFATAMTLGIRGSGFIEFVKFIRSL
jgi:hypothetical protein